MKTRNTESRSQSRTHIFNLVFEYDFLKNDCSIEEMLENYYDSIEREIEEEKLENPDFSCKQLDKSFIESEFKGIIENIAEIDGIISEYCRDWDIRRILKTDLSALRIAVYEICFLNESDIPAPVSANEAVNLAKEYGNDKSQSFVNGLISSVIKGKM